MGIVHAKIVKKSIFSEMKLASSLIKKDASFPLKIVPAFSELVLRLQAIINISCFLYSCNSANWFLDEL